MGGEPLHKGFVEVIHPEGPRVYARHVYQLTGARSHQSYEVVISIWTSSLACAGAPTYVLPVAAVVTNESGNGLADAVHAPELLAALGLRGVTIGGEVTFLHAGSPAYTTGCRVVQLDESRCGSDSACGESPQASSRSRGGAQPPVATGGQPPANLPAATVGARLVES